MSMKITVHYDELIEAVKEYLISRRLGNENTIIQIWSKVKVDKPNSADIWAEAEIELEKPDASQGPYRDSSSQ